MTSIGTLVVRCPRSASRLMRRRDVLAVADVRTKRADRSPRLGQVRAGEIDRGLDASRDGRRQRAGLALRGLQLHQDRGEPLREVVVNVARQPVALLEDRLAALFEPLLLRPAGSDAAPAPPDARSPRPARRATTVPRRSRASRVVQSAIQPEVPVAEHERRDQRRAQALRDG